MSDTESWLSDYGKSHADIRTPAIYWAAVPILVLGTVGMLWSLPTPREFTDISPILNWGTAFLMAAVVYYFIISISLAIGMLPFVVGVTAILIWLERSAYPVDWISSALVVAGLIGLYVGQRNNGGLRAVMHDVQLMMIAPAWLLSNLYRKLGIPY